MVHALAWEDWEVIGFGRRRTRAFTARRFHGCGRVGTAFCKSSSLMKCGLFGMLQPANSLAFNENDRRIEMCSIMQKSVMHVQESKEDRYLEIVSFLKRPIPMARQYELRA